MKGQEYGIEQFRVTEEPFYQEVNGEIGLFSVGANKNSCDAKRADRLRENPVRAVYGP